MTEALLEALRPQPTGRMIATFGSGVDRSDQLKTLERNAGAGVRALGAESMDAEALGGGDAVLLEELGIAILPERDDAEAVAEAMRGEDAVEDTRPEFWMFDLAPFADTADRTWGVAATGADVSPYSGYGVKLCVLDTGIDQGHRDFAGRSIVTRSFVPGETVHDGQGHGTHCAGTAAGSVKTRGVPRYGVAPEAELVVGKVLNNQGSGREGDILAAMIWAIQQGCDIISMSLGRSVRPGETFAPDYERVGRYALSQRSLVIAAAGNESRRDLGFVAPVGAPANSPSIMAVAALDPSLDVASFSCGSVNPDGGAVDIAGPGVAVFSSVPRPRLYRSLQGTSMATPHVAGLAALWAESDPSLRGQALWDKLVSVAQSTGGSASDVGAGLALAPSRADGAKVA